MVQRLLSYPTQYMNPLMRSTLHHIKLKSQNFLQRIDFDIIQDEKKLVLNSDQGRLWFPSAILALSLVSINIIILDILIQSALKMREQLLKFSVSQTSHGKKKLGALFDLIVGKCHLIRLEEKNSVIHRVLNKRITLR